MRVGSLFSGIGGFDLGLERAGYDIAWQVENNDYCRSILRKHWPAVPCHADIKTIDWRDIPAVDLICGGFPCQPFSVAGQRRGARDDRYLWPEVVRCLTALRPTWFLGENVPGLINLALDQVCTDLERLGYEIWPVCLPACAVDAQHIRQRVWIVAYASCHVIRPQSRRTEFGRTNKTELGHDGSKEHVAHANGTRELQPQGCQQGKRGRTGYGRGRGAQSRKDVPLTAIERLAIREGNHSTIWAYAEFGRASRWPTEPELGRVAHGVPHRVDRLRGLGNAVVPQIVEALGRMILQATRE